MRTTLNLDDDVLRALRTLAAEQNRTLGAVASDLVRRALRAPAETEYRSNFPVFKVREGAGPLTPDMVRTALDDE